MVQKEVKKKTSVYGMVAVLSAIVLISIVYAFGSPAVVPLSQTPNTPGTTQGPTQPEPTSGIKQTETLSQNFLGMKTFASTDELKSYLVNHTQSSNYFGGKSLGITNGIAPMPSAASTQGVEDYSTTNIQVAGVDEADIVKTDGQYIYTLSTTQNSGYSYYGYRSQTNSNVYIISADPQNAKVISKITLDNESNPSGLFLSQDSTRLIVLSNKYQPYVTTQSGIMSMPYYSDVSTSIYVYDVSNKASPVLDRNFTVTGSYFNSRMIGNYVYAVTTQNAYVYDGAVTVPAVYNGGKAYAASPTSIYYSDMNQSNNYSFTSFYGIDVSNDQQQPTNMTVLMSGASTMYVSPDNIYVAYPNWVNGSDVTSIYRVKISGLQLTFEAQGDVPGYTINQYAMDEYHGNLRLATNLWQNTAGRILFGGQSSQINNVYVLNQNLTVIGKLEGLAQGENLHSVRFMGDKCYLVTFIKTDPLFVIDLSQPANPKVLGELKIPGYSDYLHPYDENHLIGVGKEAVDATGQSFAWYQGLKLSLFDVSNVNNPVQLTNYVIGDRGTDSPALTEPKAFLFDKSKNLLVIPVSLAIVNNSTLQQTSQSQASAYGTTVWQGAYVFTLTTNGGFVLKGTITHLSSTLLDNQGYLINSSDFWSTQNQWITRSLYVGNTLYTISNGEVKLTSLTDMSQIAQVNLQ
jgi:inhibitor of cysteine peptidase